MSVIWCSPEESGAVTNDVWPGSTSAQFVSVTSPVAGAWSARAFVTGGTSSLHPDSIWYSSRPTYANDQADPAPREIYGQARINLDALPGSTLGLLLFNNEWFLDDFDGPCLGVNSSGQLVGLVGPGDGLGGAPTEVDVGATALSVDTWYDIRFHMYLDRTEGIIHCELRETGAESWSVEVDFVGETNPVSIEDSGSPTDGSLFSVAFAKPVSLGGLDVIYDDVVIYDPNEGTQFVSYPENVKLVGLVPTAEGDHIDFTPSAGTDNAALVDDVNHDSDTTYVQKATDEHYDLYVFNDTPATVESDTTPFVLVNMTYRGSTTGGPSIEFLPKFKSGGVEYEPGSLLVQGGTIETVYRRSNWLFDENPVTSAPWTQEDVDSIQSGPAIETISGTGTKQLRVTQYILIVGYHESAAVVSLAGWDMIVD